MGRWRRPIDRPIGVLLALIGLGLVGIAVFAVQVHPASTSVAAGATAAMIGGASLLVGGFLGFLFAIPRTLHGLRTDSETGAMPQIEGDTTRYLPNTNFEEVSDWLTKILIGVGLTQLLAIPNALEALAETLKPALGDTAASGVFGVATTVYFLICGYLLGYVWTRVWFGQALLFADRSTAGASEAVEAGFLKHEQDQADAHATNMVSEHIGSTDWYREASVEQMEEAIRHARIGTRSEIVGRAAWVVEQNATPLGDKAKLARTIPVFQAWIKADGSNRSYSAYGHMAIARLSLPDPDWNEALNDLNTSIAFRDQLLHEPTYRVANFYRAVCLISLDTDFRDGRESAPDMQSRIESDLRAWYGSQDAQDVDRHHEAIDRWLQVNKKSLEEILSSAGAPTADIDRP